MDGATLFSNIIGHVAWPIAIITITIILRKPISVLANRIEQADFKNTKIMLTKSEKYEIEDKAAESFSEEANQFYKDIIKSAIELDVFALT